MKDTIKEMKEIAYELQRLHKLASRVTLDMEEYGFHELFHVISTRFYRIAKDLEKIEDFMDEEYVGYLVNIIKDDIETVENIRYSINSICEKKPTLYWDKDRIDGVRDLSLKLKLLSRDLKYWGMYDTSY